MARENISNRESNIRPDSSTDAPLVIDLPDGQKLFVGKIDPGTVIEVATWRGTGRPDSRTNRIIVGMSSGQVQVVEEKSPEIEKVQLSTWQKVARFIYTPKNDKKVKEKSRKSNSIPVSAENVQPSDSPKDESATARKGLFNLKAIRRTSFKKGKKEPNKEQIFDESSDFLKILAQFEEDRNKVDTISPKRVAKKVAPKKVAPKKATPKKRTR